MFELILNEITNKYGNQNIRVSEQEYKDILNEYLPLLDLELEPILGASKAIFGDDIFRSSKTGIYYQSKNNNADDLILLPIDLGTHYIKSQQDNNSNNNYISINSSLLRCNLVRPITKPASINIELEISGYKEKEAFEELYKNYRRPIQKLLESNKIEFFTSYASDTIGSYKGNSVLIKLDEYFSDQNANEPFFLSKNFISRAEASELIRVFIIFTALYDSCNAFLSKRKDKDRFYKHLHKLI